MLEKILGSDTAMKIMLHLVHYGEIYPSAVAKRLSNFSEWSSKTI